MTLAIEDFTGCLIGGDWYAGARDRRLSVINPATGEAIGSVPDCGEAEAIRAAEAAGQTAAGWAATPAVEREAVLAHAAELMLRHKEDLARIITVEQGKPLAEARDEVVYGVNFVKWYAAEGRRLYGDTVPSPERGKQLLVFREPVGPTLLIAAGNDPFAMITRKGAPALAAGCPLVIKPARDTPFSALAAARLFREAGLPPGVINVVTTARSDLVGDAILGHPAIRHVTFTGSSAVGKALGARAGGLMKGMTLELGGHAPFVVFDDADLELAVADLLARKFTNAGQTCSCPQRIFLHRPIADRFIAAFLDGARRIKVGNGLDPAVDMGPLLNAQAMGKVEAHLSDAVDKGAEVVLGGERLPDGPGTFFPPTVLTNLRPDTLVAREETFGPVAGLFTFDAENDLVKRVNHPTYGLTGYCYTRDLGRAFRMAAALRCGFVGINDRRPQGPEVPMGGVRDSGVGREGGRWGIEEFTTIKYVSIKA
jgi:succinate-semialdehyde dehydrogenase/glutarate-semialdehyde dehydrogenase